MSVKLKFKHRRLAVAVAAGLLLAIAFRLFVPGDPGTPMVETVGTETARVSPALPVETLRARVSAASTDQFPELMRLLLAVKDPATRDDLMAELMRRWLADDMQSFVAFLDEIEIEGDQIWNRLVPAMMVALQRLDGKTQDVFLLQDTLARVILKLAETDPANALSLARHWLTDEDLDAALAGIAAELVLIDQDAAMALVGEVKALSNRGEAAADVGQVLGARNPELALAWADSFAREIDKAFAMSGVLGGMADLDPARAAAEYAKLAEAMKSSYREQVLADRAAAGMEVEEEYEGLTPEEIIKAELARPNPNLIYLERAAFKIATALAMENPDGALEWAKSLDIYQGRLVAMEAVFGEWTSGDPEAAFRSLLLESDRRPQIAERVFETWASRQPAAATEAALTLPEGPERGVAIEGAARGWIDSGATPGEVARWADSLPTEVEKDRVRAVVASEAAFDDPLFAWKLVDRMQNRRKQAELFHEIFPGLAGVDPKLARRALDRLQLPAVEAEYLGSMLEP